MNEDDAVEREEDVLPKRMEGFLWRKTKLGAHARRAFVLDAGVLTYTSPTKREVVEVRATAPTPCFAPPHANAATHAPVPPPLPRQISMDNVKDVVRRHNDVYREIMLVMFNGQAIQIRAESRAEYHAGLHMMPHLG